MERSEIENAGKKLQSRFPVLGHLMRMGAVKNLAKTGTAEAIPFLFQAINSDDIKVAEYAEKALRSLKDSKAIDEFCRMWYEKRDKSLEAILTSTGYTASAPKEIRVATTLKTGKMKLCDDADSVKLMPIMLSDKDPVISKNAEKALGSLKDSRAIDEFCRMWYEKRDKSLEAILTSTGYTASAPKEIRVATALKTGKTELCDDADSVKLMPVMLSDKDPVISKNAEKALQKLKNIKAIDEFCKMWYEKRDKILEAIIAATGYTASAPKEIRVATALKTGKTELCHDADSVELMPGMLSEKDPVISKNAEKALQGLKDSRAIDEFCRMWYEKRDKSLAAILTTTGYTASAPKEIRVATALKTGKTELCDDADSVKLMPDMLSDKDPVISKNAEKALRDLKNPDAIDVLCDGIINGTMDKLRNIALEINYQQKSVSRRCLFFVITGQVERYLELDYEYEYLRAEYQAAPEEIKNRIREAIQQSNDNRLVGLFGEVRKKFVARDLTEHEAGLMLDIYERNGQMEEIFALMFFAPLSIVVKALDKLINANWEPADERSELMENIYMVRIDMGENPQLPAGPEVQLGPVFNKWITDGRSPANLARSDEELKNSFNEGDPPEAATALSSLFEKNLLTSEDHEKARNHAHWMVRLAYASLNDWGPDAIFFESPGFSVEGGEYWIRELIPTIISGKLHTFKAVNIKPEMLQVLIDTLEKAGKKTSPLRNWAMLLMYLSAYTLRNTITIGNYEKRIEDTAIII